MEERRVGWAPHPNLESCEYPFALSLDTLLQTEQQPQLIYIKDSVNACLTNFLTTTRVRSQVPVSRLSSNNAWCMRLPLALTPQHVE